MATFVVDIQKGDGIEVVFYDSKNYLMTTEINPLSTDVPAKYMKDGVGEIFDAESNPLVSMEGTRLHLSSFVCDVDDAIFRTDGKIFNAIV